MRLPCILMTVVLFAGYPASSQNVSQLGSLKDNTLFEDAGGAFSNGAGQNFFSGRNNLAQLRRGVVAFDVPGNIPSGSTIDSVRLTLFMSQSSSGPADVDLHLLTQDWGEGTSSSGGGMGAPSTTGDATWVHTFYDTVLWGSAGGDFSTTASASRSVDTVGFYDWGSTARMIADVQGWVDNPAWNFGWILIGNEILNQTAKRFDTKENVNSANRPLLTVYWSNTVPVDENPLGTPSQFSLDANYPNPFNPSTTIGYAIPEGSHVLLRVYNLLGQEIATLVDGIQPPGYNVVRWNGRNDKGLAVPTGVYLYHITAGSFVQTRSMILSK